MAEVALPILALGGLYIWSNNSDKDKNKDSFINMGVTRHLSHNGPANLPNTNIINKNFPKQNQLRNYFYPDNT